MGDVKGYLKVKRDKAGYRPVCERLKDYREVTLAMPEGKSRDQASRCMDCGTPFCNWACPVGNYIPEWNDLVYRGHWKKAWQLLQATNNFPEFTGRLCPATCEYSCVLGINDDAVTIRENELAIIERAFSAGMVKPAPPSARTGKKVAVVGSGPAGLACADQLNKAGHLVTVFEKDAKAGGILRYGIPDFKLEKSVIDRRLNIMKAEGVIFVTGKAADAAGLKGFDAVCIAAGSRVPRDLGIDGRELKGIHFAMDYLSQSNKRKAGERVEGEVIDAAKKSVVVIGGGDTGSDCVGTANRQGALCVTQLEILPKPPECRTESCAWPRYPLLLKTTSSHEEGGERRWSILTKKFAGENGQVSKLNCVSVETVSDPKKGLVFNEIPGSQFEIYTDMVILAMGFTGPGNKGLIEGLGAGLDKRGNIATDAGSMTSAKGVFACGDARRGQSLVVWAISEGRRAARGIDKYLMGESFLPAV